MARDAIQKTDGSSVETDQEQVVLSDRELAMMEIDEQLTEGQIATGEVADESAVSGSDESASAPSADPEKPEVIVLAEDELDKYQVLVKEDGQELVKPLSEVTRGYQKDVVGSRKLQLAADQRKQLEKDKRELDEKQQSIADGATGEASLSAEVDEEIDAQIATAMTALIDGDEKTAAEALKEVITKGRSVVAATPQVDLETLREVAENVVDQKQAKTEQETAWNTFVEDNPNFADESSSSRKYGDYLFNTEFGPKLEAGELSYQEALNECAKAVAEVYPVENSAGQESPVKTVEEPAAESKRDKKRSLDRIPVAGGRAVITAQPDETMDDTITEMRKRRGQIV